MGDLTDYRRTRDATRTPEPVPSGHDDTFVIQEHHAGRPHWDIRLERGGVLVSWAVPKGLPAEPGVPRLAIRTEDHPLAYATFAGQIPRGEHGAGRMTIWDTGHYETRHWTGSRVEIVLHGDRANGRFLFTRKGENWLLHRLDRPADPSWTPLPEAIAPMLATPGTLPPTEEDEQWSYEFNWDGVRALARVEGGRLTLFSRNGDEITAGYPEIHGLAEQLGSTQALLDGELIAFQDGKPSFAALQRRMHLREAAAIRRHTQSQPVHYLVFDLLHLDGQSTMDLRHAERRRLLDELALSGPRWLTPPAYPGAGAAVLRAAQDAGLEGVVAKRLSARYHPGRRSPSWVKVTDLRTQEVVIGGWRTGHGRREGLVGSLMLGVPAGGGLRYIGQVGTGFTQDMLQLLTRQLTALARKTSPFTGAVPADRARATHWVTPSVVGEVTFREWSRDGRLRTPSWRGLRPDRDPADITAPPPLH
ncbi:MULTISPECIES: non-homologous end-joining DNA ligase [unclassified Crossiella]|uniref:non-homologous end-joining DNA ligase n=1 Tax=unclassified Crossiella TaxID=2620835 RepID=UPI001FFECBD9|nr:MULTISPECIES: non-homologous end-joining DNA ligase [unclassified Crossiella]MCK2238585.1 non-homologous end-joining DNA ligase [Crossiella sp. S99.2]MCK2251845.1 non-homologous end-joining DNA ligase [Crossiella sp. S99.1]